ncbi:MAG TPA: hypothetical protein VGF13_19390 [Verrucomicrobiae bacterium]|jgi:hypothetical protein
MDAQLTSTNELVVPVHVFMEEVVVHYATISPGMTADALSRQLDLKFPAPLYSWPAQLQLRPDDDVYRVVRVLNYRLYARLRKGRKHWMLA